MPGVAVGQIMKELIFWVLEIHKIRSMDAPPSVEKETKLAKLYFCWLQKV